MGGQVGQIPSSATRRNILLGNRAIMGVDPLLYIYIYVCIFVDMLIYKRKIMCAPCAWALPMASFGFTGPPWVLCSGSDVPGVWSDVRWRCVKGIFVEERGLRWVVLGV